MWGGMSGSWTADIKVFGYNMDLTNAIANDLKEQLAAPPGYARRVQLSRDDLRPEFNVVFDRDRLAYYGMNSATASQFVRNRINGMEASKYREGWRRVRHHRPLRRTVPHAGRGRGGNITLYNMQGRPVKLKEVGEVQEEYAAPESSARTASE